tara:strand:+ start:64 stop:201 length:138 start_codon:yes stop_codon:yes gene_type:complete
LAYLILDIETIPLSPIDNKVEEAIAKKKYRRELKKQVMILKMQNL